MEDKKLVNVWVNPLAFLEVDEPWASPDNPPDHEALLRFLCTPGIKSDLDSIIRRYQEISKESKRLFAAPIEKHILSKLVWPLRYAKASYTLGNYIGTISLCGMVAEMVAILLFKISEISVRDKPLEKDAESKLFGSRFEKLGQKRRVEVLHGLNLIDDKIKSYFDLIREKRREHLHFYSQDQTNIAQHSREVYQATVRIVVSVIGQDIKDGKLILNPNLLRYLDQKGLVESPREDDHE